MQSLFVAYIIFTTKSHLCIMPSDCVARAHFNTPSQHTKFILIIPILDRNSSRTVSHLCLLLLLFSRSCCCYFSFVFNSILLHWKLSLFVFFCAVLLLLKWNWIRKARFKVLGGRDKIDRLLFGWSEEETKWPRQKDAKKQTNKIIRFRGMSTENRKMNFAYSYMSCLCI